MTAMVTAPAVTVDRLRVDAFRIPTDLPESDGTLNWSSTTLVVAVVVEVAAGGRCGFGYTYADVETAALIHDKLRDLVVGIDLGQTGRTWARLVGAIRSLGRQGITAMAISAVDSALWGLRARLCATPLAVLLGMTRERVLVYGSGGFTPYTTAQLQEQLGGWAAAGIPRVKMKVGRDAGTDIERARAARVAIDPQTEFFVDVDGGLDRKQAVRMAAAFGEIGLPGSGSPFNHLDLTGLCQVRDEVPEMEISAGAYGYGPTYCKDTLAAGAVDVSQGVFAPALDPLRAGASRASGCCPQTITPHRRFSRSRSHRTDAFRRGARAGRRLPAAASPARRQRFGIQTPICGAICLLK